MDDQNRSAGGDGPEEEAGSRFGRAKEFMGSKVNEMRERVEDVDFGAITDQVRSYVRSNPGKALLISIGVGFVIGLLLRGGDEDEEE
ncbi:MAG TPA: DUF883 C-terminal domain-containing protein [Thermoanaerobaculia bacterium]|jgi:ElaB/YqjD/DUF883 family membrane-anchored ribosome-binding protein|nr:DUF883 C-terminal domain-containing protein [Thermoanaerobaculia bacterium]